MKIEVTNEQVLEAVKPITRASVDDWEKTMKDVVYKVAAVLAYVYTLGAYIGNYVRHPGKAYKALVEMDRKQQPAPLKAVKSRGETRAENSEAQATAVTKTVKRTRSRKRSAKGASNTTPAATPALVA